MAPPTPLPRVLIVDDDEGLLILMAESLRAEDYDVTTAASGRAALKWLEEFTPDLMLLDLKLRDVNALAILETLKNGNAAVPFIIVTGQGDEKAAVEVMKRGAFDYVTKNTAMLDLLPGVVKRTLSTVAKEKALSEAETERQRLEAEVIAASERERQSIGADLHDGLGQQLTAIELMCAALKKDAMEADPRLSGRLDQISGMLREAVAQTRYLSRGLVPVGGSPDALQNGLTELAERANGLGGVRCWFDCKHPVLVDDPEVAGQLYRIAQEATNNALKHARATQITIRLEKKGALLCLEITDNGSGLSAATKVRHGLGLEVMQHRAKVISAKLAINSKRGEGLTILCELTP
jgi:signal transduction histidine kinase